MTSVISPPLPPPPPSRWIIPYRYIVYRSNTYLEFSRVGGIRNWGEIQSVVLEMKFHQWHTPTVLFACFMYALLLTLENRIQ